MSQTSAGTSLERGNRDESVVDVGLLLLRAGLGLIVAGHGAQKLFGWFGGGGLQGTAATFRQLGYDPAWIFALIAGLTEVVGGLLLTLGLLAPLATAMIIGMMVNAIVVVHWPVFWWTQGGLEHPLTFALIAAALAFTGPGRYAVDTGQRWQRTGPFWAVGSIVLGVFAAALALVAHAM